MRTPASYLPELNRYLDKQLQSVDKFANKFSDFFMEKWAQNMPQDYKSASMCFYVAGFNKGEDLYGHVFKLEIPTNPDPIEVPEKPNSTETLICHLRYLMAVK